MTTRRQFTLAAASAAAALAVPAKTQLGVCTTCYLTATRPRDTIAFLEHCHSLGAGGIQAPITNPDPAYIKNLRAKLDEYGMYYEGMIPMPKEENDAAYEAQIVAAKSAGATVFRSGCLSGRRYETFNDLASWKTFVANSEKAIERAARAADKHKVAIGIENHKDWTAEEHAALMRRFSSEYLGVTLDTGNNFSLLDEPYSVIETLAPWAVTTHIKDMALGEYADGFLLSEVNLGDGMLDMPRILKTIRKARPKVRIILEMITRDPLKVPVWTDKYWLTFADRRATALAKTIQLVKKNPARVPPPMTSDKPVDDVKALEAKNVDFCLRYFHDKLEPALG
jgi:3-oxoisoapionate decarboxylase